MIDVTNKAECTGCTACASACPCGAISMIADEEGFFYPQVSLDQCTDCGLCDHICPALKPAECMPQQARRGFLIRHADEAVLSDSTSGGFFTAIAEWAFQQGGAVCAATFDDNFQVVHAIAEKGADLHHFRGSKYVQSSLNNCFVRIKELLKGGRMVVFVGTPCQVYGLKAFLGKEYDGLYTVDLVCHGVPSPKLWDSYLQYQQRKHQAKVVDAYFRSKEYGYQSSSMKLIFENGRQFMQSGGVDLMLRSFYADIASRPSCYACPFKVLERCSDYTIYDAWHAHQYFPELRREDERGYTNVIVHTERAAELLKQLPQICIAEIDIEKAIALDGKLLRRSAIPHPKRRMFYQNMSEETIAEQVQIYVPVSCVKQALQKTRPVLYRLGLLKIARRISKMLKR